MAINVEVVRHNNESAANVIRRFQKRVQNAGIIPKVRSSRYYTRIKSRNVQKYTRLKKLIKKDTYETLLKLGKIQESQGRRR